MLVISKDVFKYLLTLAFVMVLSGCGAGSESSSSSSSSDSGSSSTSSTRADLEGVWQLDSAQAQGGEVTISFDSNNRGQNVIDVPGFAAETRGYGYRLSGDDIYFTYDEVGAENSSPSTIVELTSTRLRLLNPDNSIGIYTKVSGSTNSGGSSGGSSNTSGKAGISIWGSDSSFGSISVYVDGVYRGEILNFFTAFTPDFGDSRTVTVNNLSPGQHVIEADSGATGATWGPTTVTLDAGDQLLFELR